MEQDRAQREDDPVRAQEQGEQVGVRRDRRGEARRSHFRSDRIFRADNGWHFTTRNENRVGPFSTREEAGMALDRFISELDAA